MLDIVQYGNQLLWDNPTLPQWDAAPSDFHGAGMTACEACHSFHCPGPSYGRPGTRTVCIVTRTRPGPPHSMFFVHYVIHYYILCYITLYIMLYINIYYVTYYYNAWYHILWYISSFSMLHIIISYATCYFLLCCISLYIIIYV